MVEQPAGGGLGCPRVVECTIFDKLAENDGGATAPTGPERDVV